MNWTYQGKANSMGILAQVVRRQACEECGRAPAHKAAKVVQHKLVLVLVGGLLRVDRLQRVERPVVIQVRIGNGEQVGE